MSKLKKSAAVILADSIVKIFPGTQIVSVETDNIGFMCDFIGGDILLSILEEQMRSTMKKELSFTHLEMMNDNAADFFRDKGQKILAENLLSMDHSLVDVSKMGDFYCLCSGPYVENTGELQFFQLDTIEKKDDITTVKGIVFPSKEELKSFVKRRKTAKKFSYRRLGEEMHLFNSSLLWLTKGVILRQILVEWWQKEHIRRGFEIVYSENDIDFHENYAEMKEDYDIATIFDSDITETLNFFKYVMTSFGLDGEVKEENNIVELHVKDTLGVSWPLSWVEKKGSVVERSVFGSLERFIFILLEKYRGNLPFWLMPEQIRILAIKEKNKQYAKEIFERVQNLCFRVRMFCDDNKMAAKICAAQKERIPYTLVIGDRERESGTVTVRFRNGDIVEGVDLEDFLKEERLH